MRFPTKRLVVIAGASVLVSHGFGHAQSTKPGSDAAALYLQAATLIEANVDNNVMSPASSNLEFQGYPPYPPAWETMEAENYTANKPARALAHEARSADQADWPDIKIDAPQPDLRYLNRCREVSNELADAALYEHLHGNDAAALETIRDLLHLANSLESTATKKYLVVLLVGVGIRAEAMDRLNVVASGIVLTKDPAEMKKAKVETASRLIDQLLKQPDTDTQLRDVAKAEGHQEDPKTKDAIDHSARTFKRINAECGMTAISLACHLYEFDKSTWPTSLADLKPFLPTPAVDPFGDGRQTLGYVLVKAGLPDGSDRPLAFTRSDNPTACSV